jgi:hypothetical protein
VEDLDWLDVALLVAKPLVKINKKGKWLILRRVPLGLRQRQVASEFQLCWLKPVEKTGPTLIVSFPYIQRQEVLTFPSGWKQQKAVRQSFDNWANPIQGGSYSFEFTDEKGVLQVEEIIYNYADGNSSKGESHLHRWNGNGWSR